MAKIRTQLVYAIEGSEVGEMTMTLDDDETHVDKVLAVNVLTLDPISLEKGSMQLLIPTSVGPALLRELLTDEQFEAAIEAGL